MLKKSIVILMTTVILICSLAICQNIALASAIPSASPQQSASASSVDIDTAEWSWFTHTEVGKITLTVLVSMVPIIELRGAIPIGVGLGLNFYVAILASLIGNILPVPFIILFFRRIFEWLATKSKTFNSIWTKLRDRSQRKGEIVNKYGFWGLCILVAIPLPGTGAWTGAMVACILDIQMKKSFPAIALGVVIAAIIVSAVTWIPNNWELVTTFFASIF